MLPSSLCRSYTATVIAIATVRVLEISFESGAEWGEGEERSGEEWWGWRGLGARVSHSRKTEIFKVVLCNCLRNHCAGGGKAN